MPVKLQYTRVPVGIVTLKNRTLSPVAQLFIDHARDVAKPLARKKMVDAMSGYGTLVPRAKAAACPHPAEGDIRRWTSGQVLTQAVFREHSLDLPIGLSH